MWQSLYNLLHVAAAYAPIITEVFKGIVSLLVVALGSRIALDGFFTQKEYELVKQRYLEGAVDVIEASISSTRAKVSLNFSRCMNLLRNFRDSGHHFDVKTCDQGFVAMDTLSFHEIECRRLEILTGSSVFWIVTQFILAEAQGTNHFIATEVPQLIRVKCTSDEIPSDRKTIADESLKEMSIRHGDLSAKVAAVTAGLALLSRILEREKLNFSSVKRFHLRKDVKEMVANLSIIFKEQLDAADHNAKPSGR